MFLVLEHSTTAIGTIGNDLIGPGNYNDAPIPDLKKAPRNRYVRRIGLLGSAAAQDMTVAYKVNGKEVARINNSATGGPVSYNDSAVILLIPILIPANTDWSIEVVDAGGTNVAYTILEID